MKTRILAGLLLAALAMQAHAGTVPSEVCAKVARDYRDISRSRAAGVTFNEALQISDELGRDPGVRNFRRAAIEDVYKHEPFSHLSPDGAYDATERACLAR